LQFFLKNPNKLKKKNTKRGGGVDPQTTPPTPPEESAYPDSSVWYKPQFSVIASSNIALNNCLPVN